MATQRALPPRLETNPQVLARFEIDDPRVIRSTLRDLARNIGVMCLVTPRPTRTWMVTRVLSVDVDHVEFEVNTDDHRRVALTAAGELYLVAELENVKVQMSLSRLEPAGGQENVYKTGLPKCIYRIQRRDGFRVRPSPPMRMVCNVRDGNGGYSPWPVIDVSVIGLALRVPTGLCVPKPGDFITHATLELEADDLIPVTLAVRRNWTLGERADSGAVVGCEFQHLDQMAERRLQVCITEIERRLRR